MTNLKNRSIAGTAAMIATMITIAAATPVRAETVSVPVAYGDVDISTPAGAAIVKGRISRAADRICGTSTGGDRLRIATCRSNVITAANVQLAARTSAIRLAAR